MSTLLCVGSRALAASFFILALASTPASAGIMLQPTAASTNMGHFNTFDPIYAIDQSGLSANYSTGVTDFDAFTTSTTTVLGGSSFNTWFSQTSTTGNFDFDLGGAFVIESFALWADPQNIGQGVNSFSLLASNDALFSSPAMLGAYNAVDGLGNANNFAQVFSFAPTSASFVRMVINSNHGSTFTTGISETAFEVFVPNPATSTLITFTSFATLRRRRR